MREDLGLEKAMGVVIGPEEAASLEIRGVGGVEACNKSERLEKLTNSMLSYQIFGEYQRDGAQEESTGECFFWIGWAIRLNIYC